MLLYLFAAKSPSIRSDVDKTDQSSIIACKLCLNDVKLDKITKIHQCGCQFCIDVS